MPLRFCACLLNFPGASVLQTRFIAGSAGKENVPDSAQVSLSILPLNSKLRKLCRSFQCRGKNCGEITPRADIHGIGLIIAVL
jgi:hypothetical protein